MGTPEVSREPFPDCILDDAGAAFVMGAVGGAAFHFLKGLKNPPNGQRLSGGAQAARMNAPRVGGRIAVWGTLFSTFDCGLVYARQKEDPWNSIISGAATGGVLSMRQGILAAGRSAVFGGVLLAFIEGLTLMLDRADDLSPPEDSSPYPVEDPAAQRQPAPPFISFPGIRPQPPPAVQEIPFHEPEPESEYNGWLGDLFRRKREGEAAACGGDCNKSGMLESSFDTPSAPIPTFEFK